MKKPEEAHHFYEYIDFESLAQRVGSPLLCNEGEPVPLAQPRFYNTYEEARCENFNYAPSTNPSFPLVENQLDRSLETAFNAVSIQDNRSTSNLHNAYEFDNTDGERVWIRNRVWIQERIWF